MTVVVGVHMVTGDGRGTHAPPQHSTHSTQHTTDTCIASHRIASLMLPQEIELAHSALAQQQSDQVLLLLSRQGT